ncbi:hypothetical protein ACEPAH_6822 [Sanghuangporus vaninii]
MSLIHSESRSSQNTNFVTFWNSHLGLVWNNANLSVRVDGAHIRRLGRLQSDQAQPPFTRPQLAKDLSVYLSLLSVVWNTEEINCQQNGTREHLSHILTGRLTVIFAFQAQGRRNGQPQGSIPRLTAKLSPQNSLKKVGPAISEVLRTSVRPRNRTDMLAASKQQKFRPNSGADAILCLDEEMESVGADRAREQGFRAKVQRNIESPEATTLISRNASPRTTRPSIQPAVRERIMAPELKAVPGPVNKSAVKIQLPGLLVNRQPKYVRDRRVSKALPSLPPPTPSPCRASFPAPPKPPKDIFQSNREKVLRGQGSPITPHATAPRMSVNCDSSSGSSYDSAEQTWNMINNMMNAVNEDEVKRARRSLIHDAVPQRQSMDVCGPGAYVTFPRMRRMKAGEDKDELTSEESTLSDRTYRTSSTSSTQTSSTYRSVRQPIGELRDRKLGSHYADTVPRARNSPPSLERRTSVASIFSVVIQPTRELSHEAQDALVAEDDLPFRIRGILQCNHGKYESSLGSRMCSRTSSTSSEGAELHPDVAVTIDALRDIELEDIAFS